MCRWLAYSGSPIPLEKLIYEPEHSLIDQSLHARFDPKTVNGDGFGVGYYDGEVPPAVFKDTKPAWADRNLRELAAHVRSPLFMAHVRASSGTPLQQTNCHPFRNGRWLWMHNGLISEFSRLKRELVLAVEPELYPAIEGSTDSEVMFFLALTFGLRDDPPAAVERMVGLVEKTGRAHGVELPVQMTVVASNGERLWAFRYSTEHRSRTLFHSSSPECIRKLHPEVFALLELSEATQIVVSEPLRDLPGMWIEVPESTYTVIGHGAFEMHPFNPILPD
jgi:glutamine amidotransferase